MPIDLTEDERQSQLSTATVVDSYEYGTPDDEDYFTATLYKTDDNKHFRHIDSAGLTSDHSADTAQWLNDDEVADWTNV